MDTALLVGLAHKSALKRKMDVVAHNIANMNTTAFKKEQVMFKEYLMDAPGTTTGKVASVIDFGISRTMTEGAVVNTNNPLDIFISGEAYLKVEANNGDTVYTRNGRMSINNERYLTTLNGEKILDDGGSPIQFEEDEGDYLISTDGTVSATNGEGETTEKATLGFVIFQNQGSLKRMGTSLYKSAEEGEQAEPKDFSIRQKSFEGSNVNAIEEISKMINIQRAYEASSRAGTKYEEMRDDSLKRLSKPSR